MDLNDFSVGTEFRCSGNLWRCTDKGERVVVAIQLPRHVDDNSWFNGPPYAIPEVVFDENDIGGCELANINSVNATTNIPHHASLLLTMAAIAAIVVAIYVFAILPGLY